MSCNYNFCAKNKKYSCGRHTLQFSKLSTTFYIKIGENKKKKRTTKLENDNKLLNSVETSNRFKRAEFALQKAFLGVNLISNG